MGEGRNWNLILGAGCSEDYIHSDKEKSLPKAMSKSEVTNAELHDEIRELREEVDRLRRMLILVAGTTAMVEGQQNVAHTYLRRVLAEVEDTPTGHRQEKHMSDLERGLKVMTEEAEEMDLPDLIEYLEE
ncbi:hypothetical protein GGQ07_001616 [Salinibacter ruber]|jgi:hypothetical protein|uniref:hypothetical protein n=1 Tax=Salinibacter ruber TaxID=146919 RepID=UPI00216A9528|nr:hypothetical protein [Salinibacter ruber]MCS4180176.1 hypothetical protein [Salinibacter ruber]